MSACNMQKVHEVWWCDFQDALSLEPNNADYMFHYGRMLLTLGEVTEAKSVFQSTLAQRPSHVLSKTFLGICLVGDENR